MRSLPETTTTREAGLASTSRSPSVATRRLPGPAIVVVGGKLSAGRPCLALNSVIASSLSKTTVSPFGPSPIRTIDRPSSPERSHSSSSRERANTWSRPSFSTSR